MGWPATLTIGVVSGIAGLALALLVGDAVARAHRVSSFEGASGYLVVFVFGPLGLLAGLGIGIAVALLSDGAGVGGFLEVQAVALAATGLAIGGVGGIMVLVADRAPTIPRAGVDAGRGNRPLEDRPVDVRGRGRRALLPGTSWALV